MEFYIALSDFFFPLKIRACSVINELYVPQGNEIYVHEAFQQPASIKWKQEISFISKVYRVYRKSGYVLAMEV